MQVQQKGRSSDAFEFFKHLNRSTRHKLICILRNAFPHVLPIGGKSENSLIQWCHKLGFVNIHQAFAAIHLHNPTFFCAENSSFFQIHEKWLTEDNNLSRFYSLQERNRWPSFQFCPFDLKDHGLNFLVCEQPQDHQDWPARFVIVSYLNNTALCRKEPITGVGGRILQVGEFNTIVSLSFSQHSVSLHIQRSTNWKYSFPITGAFVTQTQVQFRYRVEKDRRQFVENTNQVQQIFDNVQPSFPADLFSIIVDYLKPEQLSVSSMFLP